MRLRRIIVGVGTGLGAAALANRLLAARAGDLPPPPGGTRRTYRWRGMDVAYAEGGDPDDPDLLLLHRVAPAGSSREFDLVFESLAADHHVVAPDLPGFGASERPPLSYTAPFFRTFVAEFGAAMTDGATCVASGQSGTYAAMAGDDAGFARLVAVCPPVDGAPARRPLVRGLVRTPVVGTALYNLWVSRPALRWRDGRRDYYGPAPPETVDAAWRAAHQPGARYAAASALSGYLDPEVDLGETLAALDVPVTLAWGREATAPPLSAGRDLAERADARLVVFDRARRLPHVEHPGRFVGSLAEEVPRIEER